MDQNIQQRMNGQNETLSDDSSEEEDYIDPQKETKQQLAEDNPSIHLDMGLILDSICLSKNTYQVQTPTNSRHITNNKTGSVTTVKIHPS